jgi:hypothetical protein
MASETFLTIPSNPTNFHCRLTQLSPSASFIPTDIPTYKTLITELQASILYIKTKGPKHYPKNFFAAFNLDASPMLDSDQSQVKTTQDSEPNQPLVPKLEIQIMLHNTTFIGLTKISDNHYVIESQHDYNRLREALKVWAKVNWDLSEKDYSIFCIKSLEMANSSRRKNLCLKGEV